MAAAVTTWIVATGTAALAGLLTIGFVVLGAPLWEVFGSGADNPRWWILGAGAIVVVLAALADVAALLMIRGHAWARWALGALSLVAAVLSLCAAYYVFPLVITVASLAVLVLILMPSSSARSRI